MPEPVSRLPQPVTEGQRRQPVVAETRWSRRIYSNPEMIEVLLLRELTTRDSVLDE